MITRESLFRDFNGHNNRYCTYMLCGVSVEDVLSALNYIEGIMGRDLCLGSGREEDNAVTFEGSKESLDLIYPLTRMLDCTGYADTAWDEVCLVAAKNGKDFDDYYALWTDGQPCFNDPEDPRYFDAFVTIIDRETGAEFATGAGAVDYDQMIYFADIVDAHGGKGRTVEGLKRKAEPEEEFER